MRNVMGFMKLVTGHERLVTGHDKKLNFSKTGHQIYQLVTKPAGHDQTGHKSHKTQTKVIEIGLGLETEIETEFSGFQWVRGIRV